MSAIPAWIPESHRINQDVGVEEHLTFHSLLRGRRQTRVVKGGSACAGETKHAADFDRGALRTLLRQRPESRYRRLPSVRALRLPLRVAAPPSCFPTLQLADFPLGYTLYIVYPRGAAGKRLRCARRTAKGGCPH